MVTSIIGNTVFSDRDPTIYHDVDTYGYGKGMQWVNESTGSTFVLRVDTPNHAEWIRTSLANNVAAVAPTVNDDETAGYSRFSRWHNTAGTNGLDIYECGDPSEGAAEWVLVYETPAP